RRGEDVGHGLPGVVLVVEIAHLEGGDRLDEIVAHHDRVARAVVVARHDLHVEAVPGEVLHVHGHGFGRGGAEARVQPQVADDEVHPAVPGEVPGHDPIPPAVALLEAGRVQADELPATHVPEDRYRHPLAHDHEVEATVPVHVLPHRVGHH